MEECNLLHAPPSIGNDIWFLHLVPHCASVVKFITLLRMLNCHYFGISSTVATVTVHISVILLPLK